MPNITTVAALHRALDSVFHVLKQSDIFVFGQGVDLTHVDVQEAIEKVISDAFVERKVVSVQFENVNVKDGKIVRDNR